jgi:hypothetical protein
MSQLLFLSDFSNTNFAFLTTLTSFDGNTDSSVDHVLIEDDSQMYLMSEYLEKLTMKLTTVFRG